MDVLHRVTRPTVGEVQQELASPPSYSTVRTLLRILEEKGHVRHIVDGPRYRYEPIAARSVERKSALRHLVKTFFRGSTEDAVMALLESADTRLSREQLDELLRRIAAARRDGR